MKPRGGFTERYGPEALVRPRGGLTERLSCVIQPDPRAPGLLLLFAIAACDPGPPPQLSAPAQTLLAADLARGPATPPVRLSDRLADAVIALPPSSLPPDQGVPGTFPLTDWSRKERLDDGLAIWETDYPLRTRKKQHRSAPSGVGLWRGNDELSFANLPGAAREGRWDISQGQLQLVSATDPEDWKAPPTLKADQEAQAQQRLNPESAGLDPADFVAFSTTLGIETRTGLLLPAPSSVTWQLDLPPGARLDLGAGLVAREVLDGPGSDGAEVVVRVDGTEVHRLQVRDDGEFVDAEVDLGTWAGQQVSLTLATDPGATPWYDAVLVTEPRVLGPPLDDPRRVVVVGIDTLRWDALTQHGYARDTTAALDSFADGAVLFEDALTSAPRTRPSFRTALTGRYPLPAMDALTMGEHLRGAGFATAGITANVHLVPRMGFADGYDLWRYDNGADADVQIGRAKAWLASHQHEDSFLFLHLMDPHTFYKAPGRYKDRYVETEQGPLDPDLNRWKVVKLGEQGKLSSDNKAWLRARYDGEVRFMADQLAGLLAWIDGLPGRTLVILHSDHGAEFWEPDSYEHNHTLYQELVHGLFWIRPVGGWAGGPHRVTAPVGLVDLVPTVLDLVGVEASGLDGTSLRPFVDAAVQDRAGALEASLAARPRPVGHLMYDTERWAVVADGHKYQLETWDGAQALWDLRADPGEQRDLVGESFDSTPWLAHLARATGWPAGLGWRVRIRQAREPLELTFAEPVRAQLLDPEASRSRRANLEWGESPSVDLAEVGTLVVSDDGLSVAFSPGPEARHALIAVLPVSGSLAAEVTVGETTAPLVADGERLKLADEGLQLDVTTGPLLLPQDSVRQRLAARVRASERAEDDAALEALRALGYIE